VRKRFNLHQAAVELSQLSAARPAA
jgi:hypothetical protein